MVMKRDVKDHVRFCPIQSPLGRELCARFGAPYDVTTAVLIDEAGAHTHSTAILRLFPSMGFPYTVLGPLALLCPEFLRDGAYSAFARNRGFIWTQVKRVSGLGDTSMEEVRGKIIGLREPIPRSWGFASARSGSKDISKRGDAE